ncbi:MAG: hypothetical protein OEU26_24305 [Candidatus Tectomicrobia bacterium]|nr:hypothetical protein [Candidatus Tectomicrobia bacterium]
MAELPQPHGSISIFGFIGVILAPGQKLKQKTTIDSADQFVSRYFPTHKQRGFVVTEPERQWTSHTERHPLTVWWPYKPRIAGAEEVKVEKKMFLEVFPSDDPSTA